MVVVLLTMQFIILSLTGPLMVVLFKVSLNMKKMALKKGLIVCLAVFLMQRCIHTQLEYEKNAKNILEQINLRPDQNKSLILVKNLLCFHK